MDKIPTNEIVLCTIRQAAEKLKKSGITEYRIRQLVKEGEINSIAAGNKKLVDVNSIILWIMEKIYN